MVKEATRKYRKYRENYYLIHKKEIARKSKKWRNKPKIKKILQKTRRIYYKKNKHRLAKQQKGYRIIYFRKIKELIFNHYGNKCKCCGEKNRRFFTLDHKNNDGYKSRINGKRIGGLPFYIQIIKRGYPKDLQILCWNCNCGRHLNNGMCPHKDL